jgi:hypothetical protein
VVAREEPTVERLGASERRAVSELAAASRHREEGPSRFVGWGRDGERHNLTILGQDGTVVFYTQLERPEANSESTLRDLCRPSGLP